ASRRVRRRGGEPLAVVQRRGRPALAVHGDTGRAGASPHQRARAAPGPWTGDRRAPPLPGRSPRAPSLERGPPLDGARGADRRRPRAAVAGGPRRLDRTRLVDIWTPGEH